MTYVRLADSTVGYENHPNEALIRGFEYEMRADLSEGWSAFCNYALQRNTQSGGGVDTSGRPIEFTYAPHNKVNAGITWTASAAMHATLDATWRDRYMAPAFWYPIAFPSDPTPRALPSYTYVNAHVSYALPWGERDGRRPLSLSVDGRNLLNERVQETVTGFGGKVAGRTLYVGVQYGVTH